MNRRESLTVFAGVAATLCGCTGFTSSSSESSSNTASGDRTVPDGPGTGSLTDPQLLRLRLDRSRPPIWFADQNRNDEGRHRYPEERRVLESTVIDTQSRANRLSVADSTDREQVDSFISATELDTETLYLEFAEVEECFRLELCRITWQPDKVSTDYARQGRPYSERCEVDKRVFEARLIRIPDTIESDSVNSYSRSIGTNSCGRDAMQAEAERGSSTMTASETETNTTSTGGGN